MGISIEAGEKHVVSGNKITGNDVYRASSDGRGGLKLFGYRPFHVYRNNIVGNQGYGIQFAQSTYNSTVYQNNIALNTLELICST